MEASESEKNENKTTELKTFPVPFVVGEIKYNLSINRKIFSKSTKAQKTNQAFKYYSQENIEEAKQYYKYCLSKGSNDHRFYFHYGVILEELGKLQEAEISFKKAIENKADFALAYSFLGRILIDLDKFEEAEISLKKAINLNQKLANPYCQLGRLMIKIGKSQEAIQFISRAIKINPNHAETNLYLGVILKIIGKLKEAEKSILKAIELKPNLAKAHYYLGGIYIEIGKLKNAKESIQKTIELKSDFSEAYFIISKLINYNKDEYWQNKIFSENVSKHMSGKDLINIFFSRAHILHNKKDYQESAKYLKLANNKKIKIYPSESNLLFNKSRELLILSNKKIDNILNITSTTQHIFIVGMPRCGSTLLESIISLNDDVRDLGEAALLENSFNEMNELKAENKEFNLANLYYNKIKLLKGNSKITTDKCLPNYQYTGIISNYIPKAKIIHCYRNPLDNILSIYRANFSVTTKIFRYSSDLIDCSKVYLHQEEIMSKYKQTFRSKIYDLNYDLLVTNPESEIKSLISWLGWEWDNSYLLPHLNTRSVSSASDIEVRSPINSNSVGSWSNYKEMLQPAIKILKNSKRYRNI